MSYAQSPVPEPDTLKSPVRQTDPTPQTTAPNVDYTRNKIKITSAELPKQVRSTLQSSTQYTGWETGLIHKDKAGFPAVTYGFPGFTCISVNEEAAHGIPSSRILKSGDLVNIDVSAELDGYFADNGCSFVLGEDLNGHQKLVDASVQILYAALRQIHGGTKIAELGLFIETEAKRRGFETIRNLVGHGIGRNLHEAPTEIPCFYDKSNFGRFRKNSVVAVETFISTKARYVYEGANGWTYSARDGSFVAQHEHTILITDHEPIILTAANGI